jgi:hypothetical protein
MHTGNNAYIILVLVNAGKKPLDSCGRIIVK